MKEIPGNIGSREFFSLTLLLSLFLTLLSGEHDLGSISGIILDAETREPVETATIHLVEVNRISQSKPTGEFYFSDVPYGSYTLRIYRLGYEPGTMRIRVTQHEMDRLTVLLGKSDVSTETITVETDAIQRAGNQPATVLSGKELRNNLGTTIAETMLTQAGLSSRSMGPAPARPVIRGLSGDRLLILEDGNRTGDLSATSPDHALTIDPMSAERIELFRGPEAFLYGSNVLGGVINVVRNQIAREASPHYHGAVSGQFESVNTSGTSAYSLTGPVGPLMFYHDATWRRAGNMMTPGKELDNSWLFTGNSSLGLSIVRDWGFTGSSAGYFETQYGIPGGFPGGHPDGVDIRINRRMIDGQASFKTDYSWARRIETGINYVHYYHLEQEKNGIAGAEFGLLTTNFFIHFIHTHPSGPDRGKWGIWFENRDYASGKLTFTPAATERTFSVFGLEEWLGYPWKIKAALRADIKSVKPEKEFVSNRIGTVRAREFSDISGAVTVEYFFQKGQTVGGSLLRTFKAPGIEELYSEGPHLAAYSFEIGNPSLNNENGLGTELFYRFNGNSLLFDLSGFYYQIQGYLFPQNTGRVNTKLPPLLDYQYSGLDVAMAGLETQLTWRPDPFKFNVMVSSVSADLISSGKPVPQTPPVSGKISGSWSSLHSEIGVALRAAADQNRVGEFETPTAGYMVWDTFYQWHSNWNEFVITIDASVSNLFDTKYRNHLSRIKSIVPEAGRNVKLMGRLYF